MKVFISYAREDIEIARKLYHDLKREGITPWMDKEDILIGANWKIAIRQAIKESSYFLALLSSNFLSKKGYVQKELKMALDVLGEMPSSEIFFLPIRLDDCHPLDEKLQDINWGDMFPSYEEGFKKILRVLAPNHRTETAAQPINISEEPVEVVPILSTKPEEKPLPKPQAQKPKYQLRKDAITVSDEELTKVFRLDEKSWRPLEYMQNDFRDNGDGTITDNATGLMWQKSGSPDYIYLKDVPAHIEKLNREKFAGYSDWRLPTVDELKSLLTPGKQSNNLYINPIFDKTQFWCWTSDQRASGGAWRVNFFHGYVDWYYLDNAHYVRAVRSRQ